MTAAFVPQAILFDWGDTLIKFPGVTTDPDGHQRCLRTFFDRVTASGAAVQLMGGLAFLDFAAAYARTSARQVRESEASGREHGLYQRIVDSLGLLGRIADEAVAHALVDVLVDCLAQASQPMPGAWETVSTLARLLPVGIVSNHPHPPLVRRTLAEAGLLPWLDPVVVSGDIGWIKPTPHPFLEASSRLGLPLNRMLFVGDSMTSDIKGGAAVGCRTVLLGRGGHAGGSVRPDYHIATLAELLELPEIMRLMAPQSR